MLSLEVIDPCNRTGKIVVPMRYVTETRGATEHFALPPQQRKDLSLCLLFQKGRCNAGARCHQIHVDPSFVQLLRDQAAAAKSCCACHGDIHSSGYIRTERNICVVDGRTSATYPLACFGRTATLDNMLKQNTAANLIVPQSKICRLHAQSRCKYGKDCKNVHLCPSAQPLVPVVQPSKPLPPRTAVPALPPRPLGGKVDVSVASGDSSVCGQSTSSTPRRCESLSSQELSPIEKALNSERVMCDTDLLMKTLSFVDDTFLPSGFDDVIAGVRNELLHISVAEMGSPSISTTE